MKKLFLLICSTIIVAGPSSRAVAQQGYEFEVYDTHLTRPGTTELELNTNFVASGRKQLDDGIFATHNMLRSSVEIGRGLTPWLEGSLYFVSVLQPKAGASYVGNRARLTASAPIAWRLPVELGLTQEVGYARPGFAENRWVYELTPIIGKSWGPIAFVLNPAFERGLDRQSGHVIEFEPRARVGYGFGDEGAVSLEYYSVLGPITGFDPRSQQKHQIFVSVEKEFSTRWELALSFGQGLTTSSDRTVVATRLEYHFGH